MQTLETKEKSQEALLTPSSEGFNAPGLKMVKNASIFQEEGVYFIRHYETIIFAYDGVKCEVNWKCSTTSDRQIRSALAFFNITTNIVDTHKGSKWNYSGQLM